MAGEDSDREWERIRWHCRRGMLEVDIVLQRFLERHAGRLSGADLKIFKELLELPDNDLWDLIVARGPVAHPEWQGMVDLLRRA